MSTMDKPTVLLVGSGERMKDALGDALERHRLMVESVSTESAVEAAFAAAPDLLVLIGDATGDGGRAVLARLGESPATATVPVILLTDEAGLERRLSAFKHGVVAVVARTASADGMARRIADIARVLPERPGEAAGELGDTTVDELVELFSQQLRTGILSVTTGARDGASAQVVLRAGRPVTEAIEELVERLRPLVGGGDSGPLRYEFHESTSARLTLLESDESEPEDASLLRGRRILLVEQNPARADVLVQELRAQGALVVVADGEGAGLERARALDPEVVVLDGSGVHGWALPALRALRRDARLRWASLLVVDAAELWPGRASGPDLARLSASLRPLVRADRELTERAEREEAFDTRLEVIGPSRTLRALTATGLGLRVSASHPRARVEIDLAEGLVAGARALGPTGRPIAEGPAALAALLAIGSGRVRVERKDAPAVANVMAPLEDALAAAAEERAPIQPSVPPPSGLSEPPGGAESERAAGHDAERLVGRLEELLERLQRVLPAAEAAVAQAEDPPTQKYASLPRATATGTGVPKPAKLIPPPKAGLPPTSRKPTVIGHAPAPVEDDDDLPEIEATAEPGAARASAMRSPVAAAPATPAAPAAPAAHARGASNARSSGEPPRVQPWESPAHPPAARRPPTPLVTVEYGHLDPPRRASPTSPPAPEARAARREPSGAHELSSSAAPVATASRSPEPVDAWDASSDAPVASRSRGPLWLVTTFFLTLTVGGGAYVYVRQPALWSTGLRAVGLGAEEPRSVLPSELGAVGADAAADAGVATLAGAQDAGLGAAAGGGAPDAGHAPDAGADAGIDAGIDGGADAGTLAGTSAIDAGALAEIDAGVDSTDSEADELEALDDEGTAGGRRTERIAHLLRLANYQRNHGALGEAEGNYAAVLALDSRNARALAGLVRLHMDRGANDQALRYARRLVAARSRNAANHVLLGDVLEALGNHRAAVSSWRRAQELAPTLRSAQQRLAREP